MAYFGFIESDTKGEPWIMVGNELEEFRNFVKKINNDPGSKQKYTYNGKKYKLYSKSYDQGHHQFYRKRTDCDNSIRRKVVCIVVDL